MGNLTITAPSGAKFEYEEVRTKGGTVKLGEVPILVWVSLDSAVAYYGEAGILAVCDGTSFRVSFQNIARRAKAANKTDDEIATAQINFRPGKRVVGESTPKSRAAKAAGAAVEAGANADDIATLLEKIAKGELNASALLGG